MKHKIEIFLSAQERNSSTLLFSALVTRIFGVKRDRENEFSSKNGTLTARAFFQKYRGLFELIGGELRAVAEVIEKSEGALSPLEASLYPILILLAKLQPSPVSSGSDEFKVGQTGANFAFCILLLADTRSCAFSKFPKDLVRNCA